MCSQADDPSQHVSDDTLRAAAQAVVDATANWHLPTTVGGARLSDALIALRSALAASATDERPLLHDCAHCRNVRKLAASATDERPLRAALALALTKRDGETELAFNARAVRDVRAALAASATDEGRPVHRHDYGAAIIPCSTDHAQVAASATDEHTLRAAQREVVREWFDAGHETGRMEYDVLLDRLAALAASATDVKRLTHVIESHWSDDDTSHENAQRIARVLTACICPAYNGSATDEDGGELQTAIENAATEEEARALYRGNASATDEHDWRDHSSSPHHHKSGDPEPTWDRAASATDEHVHHWTDAPDDEEGWYCSSCGVTEYPNGSALAASATDKPKYGGTNCPIGFCTATEICPHLATSAKDEPTDD